MDFTDLCRGMDELANIVRFQFQLDLQCYMYHKKSFYLSLKSRTLFKSLFKRERFQNTQKIQTEIF